MSVPRLGTHNFKPREASVKKRLAAALNLANPADIEGWGTQELAAAALDRIEALQCELALEKAKNEPRGVW